MNPNPIGPKLYRVAKSYLRTPWIHQARKPGVGLDCVGLVVCAARECGVEVVDRHDYGTRPDGHSLVEALDREFVRIDVDDANIGDVLAFEMLGPEWPQHVAILGGPMREPGVRITHTWTTGRRVTESVLTDEWRSALVGAWRIGS